MSRALAANRSKPPAHPRRLHLAFASAFVLACVPCQGRQPANEHQSLSHQWRGRRHAQGPRRPPESIADASLNRRPPPKHPSDEASGTGRRMESEGTGPSARWLATLDTMIGDWETAGKWLEALRHVMCSMIPKPKAYIIYRSRAPADSATPRRLSDVDGHPEEPVQGMAP